MELSSRCSKVKPWVALEPLICAPVYGRGRHGEAELGDPQLGQQWCVEEHGVSLLSLRSGQEGLRISGQAANVGVSSATFKP